MQRSQGLFERLHAWRAPIQSAITVAIASVLMVSGTSTRAQEALDFSAKKPGGDPMQGLPKGTNVLTYFGARAVISPDGKKIAFVGESPGDAYEYDIAFGTIKNLTAHTPHNGFYRVQYLPDGNYILTGLRRTFKADPRPEGRQISRDRQISTEIFYMGKDATGPVYPLNARILEGVATSKINNRIAWAEADPKIPVEDYQPTTKVINTMRVADVVVHDGTPSLANVKVIAQVDPLDDCMIEAQDFRNNDTEVMGPCYLINRNAFPVTPNSPEKIQRGERVVGVSVDTGEITTYFETTTFYAELEGVAKNGKWALVECGVRNGPLDICRVDLTKPAAQTLERITFGQDFGPVRFSNPTVSPDGKWAAFQVSSTNVESGTGFGFVLVPLPDKAGQ